jgi:hypothetical protein
MSLDLDTRTAWPEELRVLLDQFPRETWEQHANLGGMARFWLNIHDGFRNSSARLQAKTVDFREGLITPKDYKSWFAPRLNMLLSHLNGHHQIEDNQFFPLFGAAEPRLVRGFDVLEGDHHMIHETMDQLVETANTFLRTSEGDRDALIFAADRFAESGDRLLRQLVRHLDDEEDLVIPLILDRGEGPLGIG